MSDIVVLGAEAQAATSIACAYPERLVTLVSDHAIVDGSDLPNVRMEFARPKDRWKVAGTAEQIVPLCPRWLGADALPISTVFERLERFHPGRMLPVYSQPGANGRWMLKGDRWHRPDAPLSGSPQQLADVTDLHGCGLVYQRCIDVAATIMTIGRRGRGTQVGCVHVLEERFFWDNILQAAEAIEAADVLAASLEILDTLDYRGFFTLNWLRAAHGLRLSSLRPVPRAIFQMFRSGGVDLLDDFPGVNVLSAGSRIIGVPTYVSFQCLHP